MPPGALEVAQQAPAAAPSENPVELAITKLRLAGRTGPTGPVDLFAQNAGNAFPTWEQIQGELRPAIADQTRAGEETQRMLMHPPINRSIPYFKAAAGMLQPTRTGNISESLGHGLGGWAEGLEEQNKAELDFYSKAATHNYGMAKDKFDNLEKLNELGMRGGQISATLEMARTRLNALRFKNVPLVGMVDTMTLDANGAPKIVHPAPEFQKMLADYEKVIQREAETRKWNTPQEREAFIQQERNAFRERYINDPGGTLTTFYQGQPNSPAAVASPAPGGALPAPQAAPAPGGGAPAAAAQPAPPQGAPAPGPQAQVRPPAGSVTAPGVEIMSPGNKQYYEELGKSRDEYEKGLQTTAEAGVMGNRTLTEIESAVKQGAPGMGAALWAGISKLRLAAGIGTDRDVEIAKQFETADKLSGGLVSNYLKTVSSRPSQMEFLLAQTKFVPNMNMTEAGAMQVIGIMRQTNNLSTEEQKQYYEWRKTHPHDSHRQFALDWLEKLAKQPLSADTPYGGGALPQGVPEGSKKIGYAKGTKDEVWQAPDGKKYRIGAP